VAYLQASECSLFQHANMNTPSLFLFPLQYHHHAHQPQHDLFQPWVFAQQDCDISNERNEAHDTSYDVFFAVQERLAGRVEFGVVCDVVVTFSKQAKGCFAASILANHFPQSHF